MPTLHWLSREEDLKTASRIPYRLLKHVETYGDADTENMLIQGDNLDGLKALLPYYAGQVKCIYIDPPYNTRSAFEHYDDNMEHTKWLSMMYPRMELLRELLSEDGSIWVTLDDNEVHYLKVICDEILGRKNFVISIAWQKRTSPDMRAVISDGHDQILVYAKDKSLFKGQVNKIPKTIEQSKQYKNPDNDPRGPWVSSDYTAQGFRPNQMYEITTPSGKIYSPPDGVCWKNIEEVFLSLVADNRIWFGKDGMGMPRRKTFLNESQEQTPWSWWPNAEAGHTQESKKEIHALFGADDAFDTPKPERLIQRVLHIATNPGDLVLDSFLGSGTTAAVAHKMGRRYIGIEIGEHAVTHCIPRLRKVIEGEQGGISKVVNWQGGGGFRFYRLGAPIFDDNGQIRADIRFAQLAAHIWFSETKTPWQVPEAPSSLLGVHGDTAYYLLYNGILKDKSVNGGNVLTSRMLASLPVHDGPKVIYGERCLFSLARLKRFNITFRQTPYDIKGR
jgi:adenine-specific DNA-methyltransferase